MRIARYHSPHITLIPALIPALIAALLLAVSGCSEAEAPKQDARSPWSAHNPQSTHDINYRPWLGFMAHFSQPKDQGNGLDYLRIQHRGIVFLEKFADRLSQIPVSELSRDQQLAFWLNLHNAEAVRLTAIAYPLENTQTLVTSEDSAWSEKTLEVEGRKLSVRDIAQDIVLEQWPDPRVLYGLFVPAKSGPRLPDTAFQGDKVWEQLDALASAYVNSGDNIHVANGQLQISSLYQRHRALFESNQSLMEHLLGYAEPKLSSTLPPSPTDIDFSFDWRLNHYDSGFDPATQKRFGS